MVTTKQALIVGGAVAAAAVAAVALMKPGTSAAGGGPVSNAGTVSGGWRRVDRTSGANSTVRFTQGVVYALTFDATGAPVDNPALLAAVSQQTLSEMGLQVTWMAPGNNAAPALPAFEHAYRTNPPMVQAVVTAQRTFDYSGPAFEVWERI